MNRITVFCLPYAGGSKNIYNDWIEKYSSIAEIVPIEYSGHGSLFGEELIDNAEDLSEYIYKEICRYTPKNYTIFGHSLGSLIGLLTALKLQEKYQYKPKALIIGGTRPPHLSYKDKKLLGLSKKDFMNEIFDMGQTSDEIIENPELIDILYDIIYNDVKVHEQYKYDPSVPKLNMPIAAMYGSDDPETPMADMMEWSNYCNGEFYIKEFSSDHFFPFNCMEFEPYFRELLKLYVSA